MAEQHTIEKVFCKLEKIMGNVQGAPQHTCMCPMCNEKPVHSHVFQENGVLNQISENGKLYMFGRNDLFAMLSDRPLIGYKHIGKHQSFNFWGFCNPHDNNLFAPIEPSNGIVNWQERQSQYLLAYKCICREINAKIEAKHIIRDSMTAICFDADTAMKLFLQTTNHSRAIKTLETYKKILEDGIFNAQYAKLVFKVVELPFALDLCLSAPITIREELGLPYFGPDEDKEVEAVNIVNIFPYNQKTIVIMGGLKDRPNVWLNEIYDLLSSESIESISIALQDILFRAEFHCISKRLYDALSDEIPLFIQEWFENADNTEYNMPYTSNIFYKYLKTITKQV